MAFQPDIADRGQVDVTLSAANVSESTLFATAETITLTDRVVRFEQTANPAKPKAMRRVAGRERPYVARGYSFDAIPEWRLTLIDDHYHDDDPEFGDSTGASGPPYLTAVGIFLEFEKLVSTIGALKVSPYGTEVGMMEYDIENAFVESVTRAKLDSEGVEIQVIEVMISCDDWAEVRHV
jgi:hypothetical protein